MALIEKSFFFHSPVSTKSWFFKDPISFCQQIQRKTQNKRKEEDLKIDKRKKAREGKGKSKNLKKKAFKQAILKKKSFPRGFFRNTTRLKKEATHSFKYGKKLVFFSKRSKWKMFLIGT